MPQEYWVTGVCGSGGPTERNVVCDEAGMVSKGQTRGGGGGGNFVLYPERREGHQSITS